MWVLATLASALLVVRSAWQLSGSRTRQLFGELVTRVPVQDSLIALTFDDGPTAYTDSVLAQLADLDAPATFFMVGRAMEQHAEAVARVVEAGHELGNHSYTHRRLVLKRPRTIRSEVERTDALIRAAGQEGEIFFRPPYGKRLVGLPLYLARRDRPTVLWDLEPDTYHRDAAGMVRYVLDRARPGSIILLHVEIASREQGRLALGEIVPGLRARGYRFVTLSRLIAAAPEELRPRRTSLVPIAPAKP